jgi:AraC family transcriptional regulator, regulatory protein of adaptative response / methylated-DNA-[protein]-cysteine methyltransferase
MERNTLSITSTAEFWQAVLARDRNYDGQFVFAVRTTGVYCRPSCPARRPKQKNVSYFRDGSVARAAGFRPCRRCLPDEFDPVTRLVEQVCACIDARPEQIPTLSELGNAMHISPWHLQRTFKRVLGLTPHQYAEAQRARRLELELQQGAKVAEAQYAAGFGSSRGLYEHSSSILGMTPGSYRNKGANMEIRYACADSPLGRLLVASTPRGICTVCLGNDDLEVVEILRSKFPAAQIVHDPGALEGPIRAVLAYLEGSLPDISLPLDLRVTAFQWQVLQAIRAIPYGETRTYTQVAEEIGAPQAVRAVANACAANPVPLIVACHRVKRKDGSLGGYRYGLARKEQLLTLERMKHGGF